MAQYRYDVQCVFWNNFKIPYILASRSFLILQFHNKTNISPYTEEYKIRANSNECPAKGKCIGTGLVKKILLKEYYWMAKAFLFIHLMLFSIKNKTIMML